MGEGRDGGGRQDFFTQLFLCRTHVILVQHILQGNASVFRQVQPWNGYDHGWYVLGNIHGFCRTRKEEDVMNIRYDLLIRNGVLVDTGARIGRRADITTKGRT